VHLQQVSESGVKQEYATGLGLALAATLPAACLAIAFPLSGDRDLPSIVGSFLVAYFFAGAAATLLGLPLFLVLNKLKLVEWWSATGAGVLVAIIALLAVRFGGDIDQATLLRFATLGGCGGFLFWIIWRTGHA
jgi:hypothetical protein